MESLRDDQEITKKVYFGFILDILEMTKKLQKRYILDLFLG